MTTATRVTLTLPPDTAKRLDDFAGAERRSRSNAASVLLDEALERIVGAPGSTPEQRADAASKAHRDDHARLCGIQGERDGT